MDDSLPICGSRFLVSMSIFRPYLILGMTAMFRLTLEVQMKSFLLCGIAIASVLMLQSVPASAQRVHGTSHAHIGRGYAGHGAGRSQFHGGYAGGYRPGYGIGVGAAAVATGALIGGAIATQNQGYYYPDQNYPGYSDPGTCIAKPLPLLITTAIPSSTANRLLDHTIQPAGVISATTGFDMLAHDRV